ncbi:GGDEF domain-containing protein [Companilactobacillus futsaii]|uniref:GGDEF domain-containing protein n=1 Tax=Companilactobacillus futsaii TaxID=938155 RepID=A0A5B7T5N5_9LACO|nr:GGDEF domain-containing protein [Companilactobacillus futsaii]QCX25702.1 GGDEF domain-containing protein [Companilactobacillus futsaii]
MLTSSFLDASILLPSLFYILGAFLVFQVLFSGIKVLLNKMAIHYDPYSLRAALGVIYIMSLLFYMEIAATHVQQSWIYINFELISIIFYTVILSANKRYYYYFFPLILLAFMVLNSALTSWESWCLSFDLIVFYQALNHIKNHTKNKFPFFKYLLVSIIFGFLYWFFAKIKFNISNPVFIHQLVSLFVMELFTIGYIAVLFSDLESRAALFRDATHDRLTHAFNYDAFDIDLRAIFKDDNQPSTKFTMMMFDIDHFKHINDTYGDLAGDEVLKEVVHIVQNVLKQSNPKIKLYRTGGEEFNVIFPNYKVEQTTDIVNRIFSAINSTPIHLKEKDIHITASFGVSEISPHDVSITDFYSRVDKALYHSKRNGRNTITTV